MPKVTRSNNKKEILLDAAEKVALRLGAGNLTLETVAQEAKVGKGGLMYHFPSKKALFEAMVTRALDNYTQSLQAALADPANQGNYVLAHISSLTKSGKRLEQLTTIIVTVSVNIPDLLIPLQKRTSEVYERMLADKTKGSGAVAAMLAFNGLFLMESLGISPLSKKSRARFVKELVSLAQEHQKSA